MRKNIIFLLSILLIQVVLTGESTAEKTSDTEPLKISKMSFLIHPVCWAETSTSEGKPSPDYVSAIADRRGGSWYDEQEFLEILALEKRINRKQLEYIEKMGPNEVMVIYPIGASQPMREIEQFAQNHLGRRCITIRSESPSKNERVDYRKLLSNTIKLELADHLFEALQKNGDDWSANALEVLFYNRMIALEIEKEFSIRALHFDPKTVETVAFGEGFEQCAMTWKAMLPYFLGLSKPIENDFELSVSGMPLLRSATFKGRVALSQDIRLFLWELKDGRFMALFTRAQARLSDPQLFVLLPFEPKTLKVYDVSGRFLGPRKQTFQSDLVGPLKVPVFTAIRQMSIDISAYIVATGVSFEEFYHKIVKVPIVPADQ